jgi:hypothetical protein
LSKSSQTSPKVSKYHLKLIQKVGCFFGVTK